jgi:5-methylcytosine-specific restriction endonuclease McrA
VTPIADMVEQMLATGVAHAAIVLAVRTIESVRSPSADRPDENADNQADKRRDAERDRKRRDRALRGSDAAWAALVQVIIQRDNYRCSYCGSGENLTADHMVPLSRGGTNDPANLCACCRDCNLRKRNKTAEEWLAKDGKQTMPVASNPTSGQSADNADSRCDLSSFLSSEELTDEGRKKSKNKGSENARARGIRMQPGAILTDEFRDAAIALGAPPSRIPIMWDEFVDYWVGVPGSRGLKLDWLATWRNRIRDIGARGTQRNGQHTTRTV